MNGRSKQFARVGRLGVRRSARAISEPLERRVLLSAGDIDPTFGSKGLATVSLGALGAADLALAPDGKIVTVASTWGRYDESVAVGRLHADGAADLSFGPHESGGGPASHYPPRRCRRPRRSLGNRAGGPGGQQGARFRGGVRRGLRLRA